MPLELGNPQSRNEAILENMLGAENELLPPQSRIEVLLTALLKSGYFVSPEEVAQFVSAWLDENITNPTNPVIDASLTVSGAAADAKTTGDRLTEQKNDFNAFARYAVQTSLSSDWEQGYFNTTTGSDASATNRIRTKLPGLSITVQKVSTINGYKFLAYCWGENGYLGVWNGEGFTTGSLSGLMKTELDLRPLYNAGAVNIRLSLAKPTATDTILPSDGVNVKYEIWGNDIDIIKNDIVSLKDFNNAIKVYVQSGNIYEARMNDINNKYYYRNNGSISIGNNTNYIGFIVPVLQNHTYTFSKSNVLFLNEDKTLIYQSGGNYDLSGATTCYSGNAQYLAITVLRTDIPESGYVISMGDVLDYDEYSLSIYAKQAPKKKILDAGMIDGSLSDGAYHYIRGKCGVRDGYFVSFCGKFESFGTLKVRFSGVNVTNEISITDTNIVIVNGENSTITQAHGLTIENEIFVLLELKNSILYINVSSGGIKYRYNCTWFWTGSTVSELCITCDEMDFSDTKLSLHINSTKRKIWYFGDSYAEFNLNTRLPYYVIEYGFDKNILFNSVSGASSNMPNVSFTTLLAYGSPKYAINATGMNDGSDINDETPNSNWLSHIQTFIALCEEHNVIPVLCTIPTIPSVNNNAKNAWIKARNYRYIDMAGAVGADETGLWYSGMLSTDNIHPSELGAVAQFMQLCNDMPEIMGNE